MKSYNHALSRLTVACVVLLVVSSIIVEVSWMDVSFRVVRCDGNLSSSIAEECTAVIVTGVAAKDGRAILMKNRDTGDAENRPVYYPSDENGSYAYIMVNDFWMGMNERGLAVMNTAMSVLAFGGVGIGNGALNAWIIKNCETVEEVCFELNNTDGAIGPYRRRGGTCIGVIDRLGKGAFIEISGAEAYACFIVDGYDSRANFPRHYPGHGAPAGGRAAYALEILEEISLQKGFVSWEDVAQNVSRYVRHKEQGDSGFSIDGEVCRGLTQAAMVAVSGDARYDGKLNCMWGEYGSAPIVGLFAPSIAYAGEPPNILHDFWNEVWKKRSYSQNSSDRYYDPERVREIQRYTFFAEDYTFDKYESLLKTIPDGLSDAELKICLGDYVDEAVQMAVNIYVEEASVIDHLVVKGKDELYITTAANSSVSDFTFDTAKMEISFDTAGPPGTDGFCYVKIPAELFDSIFIVMIDEDEYVIGEPSEVGDYNFIYLIYDHHLDSVRIGITVVTAPSGFAYAHDGLVFVIVAALALLLIIFSLLFSRRLKRAKG